MKPAPNVPSLAPKMLRTLVLSSWILLVAVCPARDASGQSDSNRSESMVAAALADDDASKARLRRYLAGEGAAAPERIADLAIALIQRLGQLEAVVDFPALRAGVDRVVTTASELLRNSRIIQLGVERGYRPQSPVVALDFGPVGAAAPGFERVDAEDARLGGGRLVLVRGPPGRALAAGIRGVRRIELALPDNAYRVILMTRKKGRSGAAPFGREVRVNGIPFVIGRRATEQWVAAALLPEADVIRPATARTASTPAGEFAFVHRMRAADETGGAVIVEGRATGGKLIIEITPAGTLPTFLTGLLVEPAQRRSDVILGGAARRNVITLLDRLALGEGILSEASRVLTAAKRSAGQPTLLGLRRPILGPSTPRVTR